MSSKNKHYPNSIDMIANIYIKKISACLECTQTFDLKNEWYFPTTVSFYIIQGHKPSLKQVG